MACEDETSGTFSLYTSAARWYFQFPSRWRKTHDSLFEKSQTVKSITVPCFPSFFINSPLLILLYHLTTVSPWQQKQQNAFSFHSHSLEARPSLEAEAKKVSLNEKPGGHFHPFYGTVAASREAQ